MGAIRYLLAVTLFCASPAASQSPLITPDGDPSVRSDTIYRLAVDPAAYASEAVVVLLDDGVMRYEMNGISSKTYRQIVQILTEEGVEAYAEQEFSYSPGHQRLTVNWVRVVRPDGTEVSDAAAQVQEADVPAALSDPVYSDTRVRRYSLSGVAPGTIVDWSYTVEELKPFVSGDFLAVWSVHTGSFTRRSRLLVDFPATLQPRLVERNLNFHRRETVSRGRRVYLWATHDVPAAGSEEFMADSNDVLMSIGVAAPREWEDIGTWYAELSRDRYALDHGIREKVRSLVHTAPTPEDTLRALQRWVAQDIRYVSVALGPGGYQPRTPAEVVTTRYGDCKDKATLFIAAARALGFRAYPVLLNSGEAVERSLPSIQQFDHAIAVVERPQGRVYVDLTADLVPYGELPESDQGRFGLIVYGDGTSEQVTLPQAAPLDNMSETRISGALSADGYVTGSYQEIGRGTRQLDLRNLFTGPIDSTKRADFARSIASKVFPGADADSVEVFDGRDLSADPRVSLRIIRGLAARPAGTGGTMILSLPLPSMRRMADAAAALEARGPRVFPIDAAKIIGPVATRTEISLTLPAGWRAQLPAEIQAVGQWGTYQASYRQTGDVLQISRTLVGARGIHPAAELPDLTSWLRQVAEDDVSYLVIEAGSRP